jgi:hypothetical protein
MLVVIIIIICRTFVDTKMAMSLIMYVISKC